MRRAGLLAAVLLAAAGPAGAAVRHVGEGQAYATIQAAVDAAAEGDVVLVHDGAYREHVSIARRLTLRSRDYEQRGENDGAVIDASDGHGHGLLVLADGVVVEGFSVFGAGGPAAFGLGAGIAVDGADDCRLAGNRCGWDPEHRNDMGVSCRDAQRLDVAGNELAWGMLGFYIEGCSDGVWRDNHARDFREHGDSAGFHLVGLPRKDGSTTERNLLVGNLTEYNDIGIHCASGAAGNVIRDNEAVGNWVGILLEDDSSRHVIAGNVLRDNPGCALQSNDAHFHTITGNVCRGSDVGIRLGAAEPFDEGSDGNVLTFNVIEASGSFGLLGSARSDRNEIYLNAFADNAEHVSMRGEATWQSPTALSYFLDGANHGGALGNHWDTYAGEDLDGDGVGDTGVPFRDGGDLGPDDPRPLTRLPADVTVQAWFLQAGEPLSLAHGSYDGAHDRAAVVPGRGVDGLSSPASALAAFGAGTWRGRVRYDAAPAPGMSVQIGTWSEGAGFVPAGPSAALAGGDWQADFALDVPAFVVAPGARLVARLAATDGVARQVWLGGGASYLTSPGLADPPWQEDSTGVDLPPSPRALRCWPNPFNPRTVLAFELPRAGSADLAVYDLAGRRVRTLLDAAPLPAGPHRVAWDGSDRHGRPLPAGVYVARLAAPGLDASLAVTLVR